MNFVKKYWKTIIVLAIIVSLFITTAVIQTNIPEPTEISQELPVGGTLGEVPTVYNEEKQYEMTPVVSSPEIKSEEPVVEQLSGYTISYVDENFDKHLLKVMKDFNINLDASYIYATIFCESTFRNTVESSSGALGYMQVLPSTMDYIKPLIENNYPQYSELSTNLRDPYTNVVYGLYYFSHIASSFGESEVNESNINKVLTCYHRGITGGKRFLNSTGHWNSGYTKEILGVAEQIRTNGGM
jgi:hypothetical protein